MTRLCISIDVEDDLPGVLATGMRKGIEEGLPNLLTVLDEFHIQGDFFFLAPIANENPDLVTRLLKAGHTIGNHGLDHRPLCAKPIEKQLEDILDSTRILERLCATRPTIFRAPNFSASPSTIRVLEQAGYLTDSSVLPGRYLNRFRIFRVYDHRGASQEPYWPLGNDQGQGGNGVLEVPVTANPLQPGTPFRLGALNRFGITPLIGFLKATELDTVVFLAHPWEATDIASAYPGVPEAYTKVCSSNLSPLREFVRAAHSIAEFCTLEQISELTRGHLLAER